MHLIGEKGPLKGLILDFKEGDEWIIGRDPDLASFVLQDEMVSRKHIRCFSTKEGLLIEDLSKTNPILVNDKPLKTAYLLKEGDHVKIGQTYFLYSEEETPEEKQKPPKAKEIEKGFETIFLPEEEEIPIEAEEVKEEEKEEEPSPFATIFEEAKEALPFEILKPKRFQLKVISGPNSGAEFGIEKNETYIIGKDPNTCDIVFHDLSVSKQHARIHIDENGKIFLEDLGSKNGVLINGMRMEGRQEISSQDLITLGTTIFLVIDQEAPAETIYSVSPIETKRPGEEKVSLKEASKVHWKKQIIPLRHIIAATSFAIIMLISFFSFLGLFKGHKIEVAVIDHSKEIKKVIEKYPDITFSYNPAQENLFLVGHILTAIEQQELLYSINQLPYVQNIENNIVIDEFVWKNINDILSDNPAWRGISVHSPKAGQYVMSGYIKTQKQAEELNDYMNINFQYLDRLNNQVVIENILNAKIASMFLEKGFSSLSFNLTNGEMVLSGAYNEMDAKKLQAILKDVQDLPGVRSIDNIAVSTSASMARVDLSDKYSVTGFIQKNHKNVGVVLNGQIVSKGDLIDGMKIETIDPNTILLEKENIKYKISYSR